MIIINSYIYKYLLTPAKNWHSFSNLSINIKLNDHYKYIIDTTIPLNYNEETNYYEAYLEILPNNKLIFQTYHEKTIF